MTRLKRHWELFARSLYLLPHFQMLMVRARMFYFVRLRRQLRTLDSDNAFGNTVMNNLKGLKHYNGRTDALIKPLSEIESMGADSRLLIIGPRNEHDLLSAIGHGFSRDRIRGLDLISYSPWIDIGDMHATRYADSSFDAVVVGWVLSYSRYPKRFADEMVRILRDGGLVAVGVEYSTLTEDDMIALSGYAVQETDFVAERINSTDQILALFGDHVDEVYLRHDAPRKRSHTREGFIDDVSRVTVIFSVRKQARPAAAIAAA